MSWAPVPNKPTVSVDVKQHFISGVTNCARVWRKGPGSEACSVDQHVVHPSSYKAAADTSHTPQPPASQQARATRHSRQPHNRHEPHATAASLATDTSHTPQPPAWQQIRATRHSRQPGNSEASRRVRGDSVCGMEVRPRNGAWLWRGGRQRVWKGYLGPAGYKMTIQSKVSVAHP